MNETPQFTTKEITNLMAILKAEIRLDKIQLAQTKNPVVKEIIEVDIQDREEILHKAELIWESYIQ